MTKRRARKKKSTKEKKIKGLCNFMNYHMHVTIHLLVSYSVIDLMLHCISARQISTGCFMQLYAVCSHHIQGCHSVKS